MILSFRRVRGMQEDGFWMFEFPTSSELGGEIPDCSLYILKFFVYHSMAIFLYPSIVMFFKCPSV